MAKQRKVKLAILFADISGSTKLFEKVGDDAARASIAKVLNMLSTIVRNKKGTIVKTIGDEIMCTFPDPDTACSASWAMQESLDDENPAIDILGPGVPIQIRVGFHFGSAIAENRDVFGDAVNVAARMAAQAKGGQIITTSTTVEMLKDPIMKEGARFVDNAPIKGKEKPIQIFEIVWKEEDATRMAGSLIGAQATPAAATSSLDLKYHNTIIKINQQRSSVVLGRSHICDLPIAEKLASRQHVRVEMRRDKFFIIDQSTNGTFISMGNVAESFLRREELQITGNGRLSLGRPFGSNCTEFVLFKLN